MQHQKVFAVVALALVALMFGGADFGTALADPARVWTKDHFILQEPNNALVVEFSMILTTDSASPSLTRFLVQDGSGRRMIVRAEVNKPSCPCINSYQFLATGEELRFETSAGLVTMSFAGQSFTFQEENETAQSTRNQAAALIAGASPEFRAALQQLAQIGLRRCTLFENFGTTLANVLFYATVSPGPPIPVVVGRDTVSPFDPTTLPPNSFESNFGAAYYQ